VNRALISRILLLCAVLALAFPVYAFAHWVMVFDTQQPREEIARQFLAGFPFTWRSQATIVTFSVGGCVAAVLLARLARPGLPRGAALAATGLMLLASLLGAWNLFALT
jgi:hypothetical protein